jgi:hypothetical protein
LANASSAGTSPRVENGSVALAGILESDLHRLTAGAQELEQLGRDRDVGEATIGQAAAPRQVEERPGGAGNAKRRHAAERDGWRHQQGHLELVLVVSHRDLRDRLLLALQHHGLHQLADARAGALVTGAHAAQHPVAVARGGLRRIARHRQGATRRRRLRRLLGRLGRRLTRTQ